MSFSIFAGLAVSIMHYLNQSYFSKLKDMRLVSFSAGVSIAYIFLHMFPQFTISVGNNKIFFILVLIGFATFHLVEKYIYKNTKNPKHKLAIEDSIISGLYHFFTGILLVNFFNLNVLEGLLFTIPIFLHTGVARHPFDISNHKNIQYVTSASTLVGVIIATYAFRYFHNDFFNIILGFVLGALIFTVTRHSLPKEREGEPLFFLFGALLYSIVLFMF
tara:strand:- start:1426 stop:2079 length:654 start_codon:yes stop_codon:yes gene_type:complete